MFAVLLYVLFYDLPTASQTAVPSAFTL